MGFLSAADLDRLAVSIFEERCAKVGDPDSPRTLQGLFNRIVASQGIRDREMMFYQVLSVQPAALEAFAQSLSISQRIEMYLLSRMLGREEDAAFYAAGLSGRESAFYETGMSEEEAVRCVKEILIKPMEGKEAGAFYDGLVEKAYRAVFEFFTAADYRTLTQPQQTALSFYYWRNAAQFGDTGPKAQHRVIGGLAIPPALRDEHHKRLELLQRSIVEEPAGEKSIYAALHNFHFGSMAAQERMRVALLHVHRLAQVYGVGMPAAETFDRPAFTTKSGQNAHTLMQVTYSCKDRHIFPIIEMNKAVPSAGFNETIGRVFLESLSHEFAHYLEGIMVCAAPGSPWFVQTADEWRSTSLPSDHFLRDQAIAVPFWINSGCDKQDAENRSYIRDEDDFEGYQNQIRERHARWFGHECVVALQEALSVREKLMNHAAYKKYILDTLDAVANKLAPGWPPHEELGRFLAAARPTFSAMDAGDRTALVQVGSKIILKACDLVDAAREQEQGRKSVRGHLEWAACVNDGNRREAGLFLKAVTEWNPPEAAPASSPAPSLSVPSPPPPSCG